MIDMSPSLEFPVGQCVSATSDIEKGESHIQKGLPLFGNDVCRDSKVFKYLKIHFEMKLYKMKSCFGGGGGRCLDLAD